MWNDEVRVDPRTSEITTFSDADGIDLGSAWLGSYKKLSSGHFLFGGSDGLVIVNPKGFSPWQFTSSAYISQITVNGKHRDLPTDHPIIIAANDKSISLTYSANDYSEPKSIKYQYKLKNYDEQWHTVSSQHRYVTYTNLPPGEFEFLLKASN